jgi:hypothetical protein
LDLLSGTELNPGQSEIGELSLFKLLGDIFQLLAISANCQTIVRTVAQGPASGICSSGRKTNFPQIIDSILDYSKLEALGGQARSSGRI